MKCIEKHFFFILLSFSILSYMCTYPNKEFEENSKSVVEISDGALIDNSQNNEFDEFLSYFNKSIISFGDSLFYKVDENYYKEIPLKLLNRITGLGLDTVHFAKKSFAIGNLSTSTNHYSLFYKLSCLAGAKCDIFYVSNFTKEGTLLFNEEIANNRLDMGIEHDNFFRFVYGKDLQVKTIVSYYDSEFEFIGDTIIYKQITINLGNLDIKEFYQ